MKRLITNADDFGFTPDVNAGIVHCHLDGVLTSTTLMANGDAFEDAVRLAKQTPSLDIGAHLVLVQGASLLNGKPLPETPLQLLTVLARGGIDVYAELKAQIEKITASGISLSHMDTHKHTHVVPSVFRTVLRLAAEFEIPWVRLPLGLPYYRRSAAATTPAVRFTDHFLGFRLTGSLTEETLASALTQLPDGTTEFMCHPGYLRDDLKNARTRLKESRLRELEALTSPRIRQLINDSGIELTRF